MERIAKPTPTDILAALKASAPGDVVIVEGDIPKGAYADLRWPLDGPPVTLRAGAAGARFVGYTTFKGVAGLRIEGVGAQATADTSTLVFLACERIAYSSARVAGLRGRATARYADGSTAAVETFIGGGVQAMDSRLMRFENLELAELGGGISLVRCSHVTITACRFHDIRSDGVQVVDHGEGLTFSDNDLRDFYPLPQDHSDGLQVRLSAAAKAPTCIVTCERNVMERGAGRIPQGFLFITGTMALPVEDVVLRGNTGLGLAFNALYAGPARRVTIEDNLVCAWREEGQVACFATVGLDAEAVVRRNRLNGVRTKDGAKVTGDNEIIQPVDPAEVAANPLRWRAIPADPRDAELAQLREELADAKASVASLDDINQRLAAQRDELLARLTMAEARVARVKAALA